MENAQRKAYSSPRQIERQQRILATARQEISRLGYEGLTMRGLADASGVALKTLYNLYSSKDELLFAAVGGLLQDLQALPEVTSTEAGLPRGLAYTRVLGETIEREPAYADAMARALFQSASANRLVDILLRDSVDLIADELMEAERRGELLAGTDIDTTAQRLIAARWGAVLLWQKGLLPLDAVATELLAGQIALLQGVCQPARRQWLASLLESARNLSDRPAVPSAGS